MRKIYSSLLVLLLVLFSAKTATALTERKTQVSENDTTAGYLNGKLVAGSGMSFVENSDGGNESLTLSVTSLSGGDITAVGSCLTSDCFVDGTNNNLTFEGSSSDAFEGTLGSNDITGIDKSWNLPNFSGDVVVSGHAFTGDVAATLDTDNSTALTIQADSVALGTDTTGNYAGSSSEAGAATTATALAANGANCSAGSGALGVDASGAAESCTDFEEDLLNSAGLAAALSDETGTSLAVFSTNPTFTSGINIGGGGARLSDAGGALTISGLAGSTENLSLDFGSTSNNVIITSSTGVTLVDYGTLDLDMGDLTVSGGDIVLGTSSIFSGGDTASLNNIDALNPTTESTVEAAIDTLANLTAATSLASVGTVTSGVWNAGAVTSSGKITGNASLDVKNGATSSGVIAIFEDSDAGTNKATFEVPSLTSDTVYVLPSDDGDNTQILQTNGSGTLDWVDAASGSGDITSVFGCTTGACTSITIGDTQLLDGGTATTNDAGEGIQLPRSTSCTAAVEEGRVCWDSDDNTLYIGDSATASAFAPGGGDINQVGDCLTGTCFAGASGTTLSSNTDLIMDLDEDNNGTESLQVRSGTNGLVAEIDETGTLFTLVGVDGIGAIDLDYGSVDITDHAFITDGTGDAEVVLPDDSIGDAEIAFDEVTGADLTLTDATTITASGKITANASLDVKNGATTSGVLAIFEDSDDGTNKATFQVPALTADTVYVLPADDGDSTQVLSTNGTGTLDWVDSTAGAWVTESNVVNLATDTDNLTIGSNTNLAKIGIDGDTDEIQFLVQANATQTALLSVWENSAGTDQITFGGTGAAVFNETGNAVDFRVESDTNATMFYVDGTNNRVVVSSDPGFNAALIVNPSITASTSDHFGSAMRATDNRNTASSTSRVYGLSMEIGGTLGSTFTGPAGMNQVAMRATHLGFVNSTSMGDIAGLEVSIRPDGTGSPENIYGVYVDVRPTITTNPESYGLYIADVDQAGGVPATAIYTEEGNVVYLEDADTIADSGNGSPATHTLTPTSAYVELTCNDTDGCTVTMGETDMKSGTFVTITSLTANVCTFADTSGVSELSAAFSMGQYDTLMLQYIGDRWIETGRSDN
ncbi:MAG: beta strand repeat-containing protein [Nitrososphaerales archaeon]